MINSYFYRNKVILKRGLFSREFCSPADVGSNWSAGHGADFAKASRRIAFKGDLVQQLRNALRHRGHGDGSAPEVAGLIDRHELIAAAELVVLAGTERLAVGRAYDIKHRAVGARHDFVYVGKARRERLH
mmetsp:Transcript_5548/g.13829  ORF Transcript_5548/g.13829 Transcript_5548/m.13829 type:complete len:130 (-) Transcript_5548:543-932(-)